MNLLDFSDFGIEYLSIFDVTTAGNEIFMIDPEYIYRFQYKAD